MRGERIKTTVLSVQIIPNADPMLLSQMTIPEGHRSLGLITTDCDDVSYAALDEATKKAQVEVVYARSMYAGAGNASTKLAGEFIGIISGENPAEVRSGLDAAVSFIENDAAFVTGNEMPAVGGRTDCQFKITGGGCALRGLGGHSCVRTSVLELKHHHTTISPAHRTMLSFGPERDTAVRGKSRQEHEVGHGGALRDHGLRQGGSHAGPYPGQRRTYRGGH